MNPLRALYDKLPAKTRSTFRSLIPGEIRRWYAHRKTDVYLLSYPKCGRTWLRVMLGYAISKHFLLPENEKNLLLHWKSKPHHDIPMITVIHDDRPMLKTPEELETSKHKYRNKKVIFLVRDPRDVIVSSYFEMSKRGRIFGDNPYEKRQAVYTGTLDEFVNRQDGGFDTIIAYYNIWAKQRNIPQNFLLVRYEDMRAHPKLELRRVVDFLDLHAISEMTLSEAVEFASFENMRKMEREAVFQAGELKPADELDQESYKTRKGKVNGYLDYFSDPELEKLNQKIEKNLSSYFGYTSEMALKK